ncbi:MAG TPA: tyrosine-type recombinase/integrase [Chthoniobacterales bacterium]|nr:tyrosine-type recombinase/integrase [Chthoniobacterales bacterium]
MSASLAPILQYFFSEHLVAHKQVSPCTIVAYRDSFRLLLQFLQKRTGKKPSSLAVEDLDAPAILDFLESLEEQRANQVCSRNARLTAIRSFFHVVALRDPASIGVVSRVLAIPRKRTDKRLVGYLTREEIDAVLAAPDQSTWIGRRDYALLLTMYNSGARLSEMTCLQRAQVKFDSAIYLQLHGKGRKERIVPLWAKTGRVLRSWFRELEGKATELAFPSVRGTSLSSDGLNYILQQAVKHAAGSSCPSLLTKRVTPHVIRHTCAMHLLQAGVDMAVIALWLGHESIETTHIYVEADLAIKQKALERIAPTNHPMRRFKADDSLLTFLTSL